MVTGSDAHWKLFERAIAILDGRANGHGLPIIRKLAARRFPPAITVLGDHVSEDRALKLLRTMVRSNEAASVYNLAITYRNRGDMLGYRSTLALAARLDDDAAAELRSFRTRFPEKVMGRFGRLSSRRG